MMMHIKLGWYWLCFFTHWKLPSDVGGRANGPFIRIHPWYDDDEGLLEHEKCHARQWWRTCGIHGILYKFSKEYRLKSELEAYGIQLLFSPQNIHVFAKFLASHYGLDISVVEAQTMLEQVTYQGG